MILSLSLCGVLTFVSPASADDGKASAPAKEEVQASDDKGAAAAPVEYKRSLPKTRQGTPVVGGKVGLSFLAAFFFGLSVFMVALIFRSPKAASKGGH